MPSYPTTIIDQPADKVILMEKGKTDATWGWAYFATWEWDWTSGVGTITNGTPTKDGAEVSDSFDCDGTGTNATWAGCGMQPRYRHNRVSNMVFSDGHAKGMNKKSLKWFKNIYVAGTGAYRSATWYPY